MSITTALIKKATKGDVSAYLAIRDTLGEKPSEKQEIAAKGINIIVGSDEDKDLIEDI